MNGKITKAEQRRLTPETLQGQSARVATEWAVDRARPSRSPVAAAARERGVRPCDHEATTALEPPAREAAERPAPERRTGKPSQGPGRRRPLRGAPRNPEEAEGHGSEPWAGGPEATSFWEPIGERQGRKSQQSPPTPRVKRGFLRAVLRHTGIVLCARGGRGRRHGKNANYWKKSARFRKRDTHPTSHTPPPACAPLRGLLCQR